MTPDRRKIYAVTAFCVAFAVAGCAPTRPDPALLGNAERLLEAARQADAQTYAPLELRFASERYQQAQSAMSGEDFDAAGRLARESVANSELAAVKARLGKARESVDLLKVQNDELRRDLDSNVEEIAQ